jgi:hypothetical protein
MPENPVQPRAELFLNRSPEAEQYPKRTKTKKMAEETAANVRASMELRRLMGGARLRFRHATTYTSTYKR